jgi:formylglycine-generating enzyme required for sulfatase activity
VRYTLPTEAEWEKAARGGLIGARYPWGDEPPTQERCDCGNLHGWRVSPMKSRPANGYGLFAMSGCVWEWTADWYDRDYYRSSPSNDPAGPPRGEEKVLRGGSWADCPAVVTTTFRMSHGARPWREDVVRTPTIGVRLCRRRVEGERGGVSPGERGA